MRELIKEVFFCNIEQIVFYLKNHNIVPVFVTYPRRLFFDDGLRDFCQKEKIMLIDIKGVFDQKLRASKTEDFFIADGHCNAKGYKLIAEIIAESIDTYLPSQPLGK